MITLGLQGIARFYEFQNDKFSIARISGEKFDLYYSKINNHYELVEKSYKK